jgi:hypothetical protein
MSRLLAHAKSNAVAYLALFVALGGTGYAAVAIPAGSVGTRQLRNRAVTESKLGRRSVGAANLDSKSIAGYVAFWASISPIGALYSSNPRANVTTPFGATRGVYQVTWNKRISRRCFLLSDVTNLPAAPAYATTLFEGGNTKYNAGVYVQTFNGAGQPTPEPVNVAVLCP